MASAVSNPPSSTKAVHFDLPPEGAPGEVARKPLRPRRRKRRPQPPIPQLVFGFYLPDENVRLIGRKVMPQFVKDKYPDWDARLSLGFGQHYSNAHCQDHFPDIPLRWRHTVLAHADNTSRPFIVLGHAYSKNDATIYVHQGQVDRIRVYLELGEQEPDWYDVLCTG